MVDHALPHYMHTSLTVCTCLLESILRCLHVHLLNIKNIIWNATTMNTIVQNPWRVSVKFEGCSGIIHNNINAIIVLYSVM